MDGGLRNNSFTWLLPVRWEMAPQWGGGQKLKDEWRKVLESLGSALALESGHLLGVHRRKVDL